MIKDFELKKMMERSQGRGAIAQGGTEYK